MSRRTLIVAAAFLIGIDRLTKFLSLNWIPPLDYPPYPFGGIGVFSIGGVSSSLNHVINTGAAWGMFSGHPGILFALRASLILFLLFFVPKRFPIWLVIAGAIGNALDYCFYGHVIDFIHFNFWGYSFPIFNLADALITIGVLSLIFFPKSKQLQPL